MSYCCVRETLRGVGSERGASREQEGCGTETAQRIATSEESVAADSKAGDEESRDRELHERIRSL